ncbi:hypothetical protein KY386_00140 [Candidatus Parcubacteria bacterium]|nr:hypothetical protein [Candidatus Parcubacteria bacterium]
MAKFSVRKNLTIAIISLLAVGLVAAAGYVKVNQSKQPPAQDQEASVTEADPSGDRAAREEDSTRPSNNQTQPQPTPQPSTPGSTKKQIKPVVTTFGQSPDKATVLIRAYTEESAPGTCVVSFRKAGSPPLERTAPTLLRGDVQRCQGFDIPAAEFPAKGEWSFSVRIFSDRYEGASAAQTINVQ